MNLGAREPAGTPERVWGTGTGAFLVIASMIGTGAYTTTGFLLRDLRSPRAVILEWLAGGVLALLGALSYAELGAALPKNGGEYQLLSRIYHPALGFVAGFVSLVVGFAAPIAASALAFGSYARAVWPSVIPELAAIVLVGMLSLMHGWRVKAGGRVQSLLTVANLVFVATFVVVGLTRVDLARVWASDAPTSRALFSPSFAVGLVYVMYAYSGWNAAAYVAGEIHDPARSLPRALTFGTLVVCVTYVGLNLTFLSAADPQALSGVVEIGHVAAVHLFGDAGARFVSSIIAVGLVSMVSAMIVTGPRVAEAIGYDYPSLAFLAQRPRGRGPSRAILLEAALAIGMILTAGFAAIVTYVGVVLSLFTTLTVLGVIVLRRREPSLARPYRTAGYPVTPLVFVGVSTWMVTFAVVERPVVVVTGVATLVAGLALHALVRPASH